MNLPKPTADEIRLPEAWSGKALLLGFVGLALIIVSCMLFFVGGPSKTQGFTNLMHSYLANFIYCLSFGIGAMFFVLISFLTRAGWSASVRRLAEIISTTIPYMALVFSPILLLVLLNKGTNLYEWNAPIDQIEEAIVKLKAADYLYGSFFVIRAVVCLGLWSAIVMYYYRLSRQQDESGDTNLTVKRQFWSGPLVMVFALTVSMAAFDWVMSIDADWFSTIFGVYLFSASMFGFFAFMIISFMMLQRAGKVQKLVTVEHYHDMGKFLFGFTMFWSYIAFSQLLLYWYGNIPEETAWFRERYEQGWMAYSYLLIAVHFAIPFLGLLSRHVRRHRTGLFFWACWAMVAHWIDMTFLVMPNAGPFDPMCLLAHAIFGVGMLLCFVALVLMRASDAPLVSSGDPRLHEAMSYANPIL